MIGRSAQLGCLYDPMNDHFINHSSIVPRQENTSRQIPNNRYHWFINNQSRNILDYMRKIEFDEITLQSLIVGTIEPSGVSALVDYDKPIDNKTLFFYYSYRDQEKEWSIRPRQLRSIPIPTTDATHMVTKIISGFEILCVIQLTDDQSVQITNALLEPIVQ